MRVTISRMRRHAPFEPTDPNTWTWGGVPNVINRTIFFENRPKGCGFGRPRNMAFPIDFAVVLTTLSHYRVRCDQRHVANKKKFTWNLWEQKFQGEAQILVPNSFFLWSSTDSDTLTWSDQNRWRATKDPFPTKSMDQSINEWINQSKYTYMCCELIRGCKCLELEDHLRWFYRLISYLMVS